ncbi:MAG: NEL-type E3 ubiquitin ligase domain-containing protein [Chlamydiota bacterium]
MSLPKINEKIATFLSENGVNLPNGSSQSELKKMQDLFQQISTLITTSEDPKVIADTIEFMDKIRPEINRAPPRCLQIFMQAMTTDHLQVESMKSSSLLGKRKIGLSSTEYISQVLGLNTWETTGNKEEAITRILDCFKSSSESLDLSNLELSSLPSELFLHLPQLTGINLDKNHLTSITLPEMPNLASLSLVANSLTSITLPDMPALKRLDLSRNSLTSLSLPDMPNLMILMLSNNRLASITFPTSMPNLKVLLLSNNQLTERPNHDNYLRLELTDFVGNLFENTVDQSNNPLKPFVNKLLKDSPFKNFDDAPLREHPVLFNQIHTWLDKLKTASDFREGNSRSQASFSERIISILDLVSKEPAFKEIFQVALSEALTSCVDRSALFLNSIELNKMIFSKEDQSLPKIASFLKGAFALDKINKISTEFVARHRVPCNPNRRYDPSSIISIGGINYVDTVDPIEVYLGFQIRLKEEFNLPIVTKGMNYSASSRITEEDEAQAREELRASLANTIEVAHFISSVDVWSKKLKEDLSAGFQEVQAPFQEALVQEMEKTSFLNADTDAQKALLESITTAMAQAEKRWVEQTTLKYLQESH